MDTTGSLTGINSFAASPKGITAYSRMTSRWPARRGQLSQPIVSAYLAPPVR